MLMAALLLSLPLGLSAGSPADVSDYGESSLNGMVLQLSPGAYMVIQAERGEPTVFMDPQVSYVNQQGQKIESREIAVGKRVKLSFVRQGPDILVTRIMLTDH